MQQYSTIGLCNIYRYIVQYSCESVYEKNNHKNDAEFQSHALRSYQAVCTAEAYLSTEVCPSTIACTRTCLRHLANTSTIGVQMTCTGVTIAGAQECTQRRISFSCGAQIHTQQNIARPFIMAHTMVAGTPIRMTKM